jgi:hypothetical protein
MVTSRALMVPKCIVFFENGGFFAFSIENNKLVLKNAECMSTDGVPKSKSKHVVKDVNPLCLDISKVITPNKHIITATVEGELSFYRLYD